jgi:hypothetical protein
MFGCLTMMKLKHKEKKTSAEINTEASAECVLFPLISYKLNKHCFVVSVAAEQLFVVGHFTSYNL